MLFNRTSAACLAAVISLAGCAGLSRERGYAQSTELVQQMRPNIALAKPGAVRTAEIPHTAISVQDAVQLAFFYNPRLQEEYARLGFARAELEDARRLQNPRFGYSRLRPEIGSGVKITRSVALGLADLLTLRARKRYAEGDLERVQTAVASALLTLAAEVEVAWYQAVSAAQIATMRALVAQAAEGSAELAQRLFDAGNISALQNAREQAHAVQARIAAVRAQAEASRARSHLAAWIGLPQSAAWRTHDQLPAPPKNALRPEDLQRLALNNRLDLRAAQQELALADTALGVNRRWAWLGAIELGAEREREADGVKAGGGWLDLELPLFNQGQGRRARARAQQLQARAALDALQLRVRNETLLGLEAMALMHDIAERYRTALVPRREQIVAAAQKEQNYMLIGVFELLLAKQEEFDAYQAYLEAVRDYWIARSELRRAVGGRLPDDGAELIPTLGAIRAPIAPANDSQSDPHAGHHMPEKSETPDPHAGHHMPEKSEAPDPHAGHHMPEKSETPDPHAGHHSMESTPEHPPQAEERHHQPPQQGAKQ